MNIMIKVISHREVLNLSLTDLENYLSASSREELIDWLQWNDPNGVYTDKQSKKEFNNILSKEEAVEIIKRQISES